jgi:hypothetical protein
MERTDRREFIVRSTASLVAAGSLLGIEACAGGGVHEVEDFTRLSSALLGIDARKLVPDPDPLDVKSQILAEARAADGAALPQLLQIAADRRNETPQSLAEAALDSAPAVADLARSIMLAWLLGTWYDPRAFGAAASAAPSGRVISAAAYRGSWVWRLARTHPMGASDVGFGSWSSEPPPLDQYIGND